MTILILAIDALDAGLINYFDVDAFRLESHSEIETFAHTKDDPFTPEVWASVATGLEPEEHGITGAGTSEWDNPVLNFASKFTGRLDESTRGTLGRLVRNKTGEREKIGETPADSIFDRKGAVVHNWPGVHNGSDLQRAWDLMNAVIEGMSRHEFERELLGLAAEQFGWAREMLNHDVSLAGVHIHTLDAAGHAYAEDEERLKRMYCRVSDFINEVIEAMDEEDELLILSDHGMRTSFYEADAGKNPASHSWRAYASATTAEYPESVFDVVEWVTSHTQELATHEENVEMPIDQLRELGYVE